MNITPGASTRILSLVLIYVLLISGFIADPTEKVLLTATFGESRGDHLHNGIDLGKAGQRVRPVLPGEMIFYLDQAEHPFVHLFGNGNLAILQHENRARSYYYHLKKGSIHTKRGFLPAGKGFALSGNSGRSSGAHLHLSYSENGIFINPLKRMRNLKDGIKPRISAIIFIIGKREVTIFKEYRLTGVGQFLFAARAYDQSEATRQVASVGVYKIAFYFDNRKMHEYSFDAIQQSGGRARLNGKLRFSEIYRNGLYLGGQYRNITGKHVFRVRVWDRNGNSATRTATVTFR